MSQLGPSNNNNNNHRKRNNMSVKSSSSHSNSVQDQQHSSNLSIRIPLGRRRSTRLEAKTNTPPDTPRLASSGRPKRHVSRSRRDKGDRYSTKNQPGTASSTTTNGSASGRTNNDTLPQQCFLCGRSLPRDIILVNAHIDACLELNGGDSASAAGNRGSARQNNNDDNALDMNEEVDQENQNVVEYEWAGQVRVRATALLEGGPATTGVGNSGFKRKQTDVDDDIDVDAEDEEYYGPAQYGDKEIRAAMRKRNKQIKYQESASNNDSSDQSSEITSTATTEHHDNTSTDPEYNVHESGANTPSAGQPHQHHHQSPDASAFQNTNQASKLVIDSLKARIRDQEKMLDFIPRCQICFEPYSKPCVSVACWHVHCEECWLNALGVKKLCPQCQKIVQPTELRRVYL